MSNSNRDINAGLRKAALEGNIEKVKSLISEGADVNATSELKETPLHWAARRGNQKVVEVLLNNRANVNAVDGNENTPLHRAAENGHKEVVEALLDKGASVNITDQNGKTPLHWAAKKGHQEAVKVLLQVKGIDVNAATNQQKETPLHFAAQRNHAEIVKDLLDKGANVNAQNDTGETPLDLAGDDGIKTLLKNAGKSDDVDPVDKLSTSSEGVQEEDAAVNPEHPAPVEPNTPRQNNGGQINTTSAGEETQTSTNSTVSIKEEGKNYDKSEYFSGSKILDHDYQDKLTNIFINSHCSLNGGERMQLAENIHQIRQIFSKYADNNIYSMWIGVFDIGKLDTDEFKEREIKSSKEKYWKNSIHVRSGDVQDKVLVYSWLDINQFNQDKWNNFLSQLEGDHKVDFIGTGPLTFKYKDFNYRVYPPLFGSSDGEQSSLSNTEVFSFSRTEVNQIIENIKRSHQSIKKQVIDHYASLNKDFVENDVDFVKIITDVNNKTKLTSIRYSNTSKDITLESEIKYETTPLHTLAKLGDELLSNVNDLLAGGADVNAMDKSEKTPLHYAAKNGHVKIVQVLLKADVINVNAVDEDGKTPLDLATDDKIKTLLENAKEPDDGLGGKSPESNEEESKVSEDTDQKTQIVDGGTPQNNEGDPGKEKQGGDIQPETGVKAEGVKPVAPTEPAQTEEQPSSFFGSLFSILMKPFSLVASFFGSFFSWLFGSDEPTQSSSESDQPVVLESPSSSEDNDII